MNPQVVKASNLRLPSNLDLRERSPACQPLSLASVPKLNVIVHQRHRWVRAPDHAFQQSTLGWLAVVPIYPHADLVLDLDRHCWGI